MSEPRIFETTERTCPACGKRLNRVAAVDGDRAPAEGDLSVCAHCGELLQFGAQMRMQRLTKEKFDELPRDCQEALKTAQRMAPDYKENQMDSYTKQIEHMIARAKAWRQRHPDKTPKVQFNFPAGVFVAATIDNAIDLHLLSTNEDGMELITEMCRGDDDGPTVFMLRLAMEYEQGK